MLLLLWVFQLQNLCCKHNIVRVSSSEHQILDTFPVFLGPHACVLYILGLQTAPTPKVPRREDFHFSALQPHPRQTWYTHTHARIERKNNKMLVISTVCISFLKHSTYFRHILRDTSLLHGVSVPVCLFCINSHRCYQGEPFLCPPKQHHSPSLPTHLPGTYLQSTQGDSKRQFFRLSQNSLCSYFAPTSLKSNLKRSLSFGFLILFPPRCAICTTGLPEVALLIKQMIN